jgi:predicted transcriptional regulator
MAEAKVLTLRLDPNLTKQLDNLAEATRRSRSFLIAEAVGNYLAMNEWQVAEMQKAIVEADRGDFASDEEVKETFCKRTPRLG